MTFRPAMLLAAAALAMLGAGAGLGQDGFGFGGLVADTTLPVEVKSDSFAIDTADGTAVFTGNVLVSQGEMRLAAGQVRIVYARDGNAIETLIATGGVTLANAAAAAEAEKAVYTIASGVVVMTGNVLLTQGQSAMAAQELTIELQSGSAQLHGDVQTTFVPGGGN